jgi:DNA-binding response OmpR family regulator
MDKALKLQLKTLRILYAEDEENIRKPIADTLRFYVKEVIEAKDGVHAHELYKTHSPDVILCDILMPRMNGIDFITKVRKSDHTTPIVMITAHTEKEYLLSAVKLHLEQYLIKPVTLPEILDALKICLEQIHRNHSLECDLPHGYHYDIDHKILTYEGEPIKLSKKQIEFLEMLIHNCHRVVTYEELQYEVWKDDVMTDNAIRSLVLGLRKKLPKELITNLSGIGYKLNG